MPTHASALWLAAAIASLAAAGCSATPKQLDPIPQQGTISRQVIWVMADDPIKACNAALGTPLLGARFACARVRGETCTIYVKPPRNADDRSAIYLLGHETLHCFAGNYHYAYN